jgi:hypothetical protein
MGISYIPTQDSLLVPWTQNFSALITASPTSYGLTAGDASAYATLSANYVTAYNAAIAGGTRGPMAVSTKNGAKAALISQARQLATIIQATPAVTDDQKVSLGLTVRKTNRTPVPAPTESPLLSFIGATPLQHTMRYAGQSTPSSRALPFGSLVCNVSVWVSATPPTSGTPPTMIVGATKNPFAVNFTTDQVGKTAYYSAVFTTRTQLDGPVSNSINALIVGPTTA